MSSSSSSSRFVIVIVTLVLHLIDSFHTTTTTTSRSSTNLYSSQEIDPYDDLLNVNKVIEQKELINLWSIDAQNEVGLPLASTRMNPNRPKKQWEHWDDFMEQEFGDMDAPLPDHHFWMFEARDVVEQKRGFAIWSKKSEKELQREMRKSLATKSMHVPENVAMIIRAVHLEKTHTMKKMKEEYELPCIEFRKWMIEQKKKSKKDPLPSAKVEVSKKWLFRPPNVSMSYSSKPNKPPPVVMDERSAPVYGTSSSAFGSVFGAAVSSSTVGGTVSSIGNNGPTSAGGSVSGVIGSTSSKSHSVVTASMVYWDKPRSELPDTMTIDYSQFMNKDGSSASKNAARVSDGLRGVFFVDGEEMFVPTSLVLIQNLAVGGTGTGISSGSDISPQSLQQEPSQPAGDSEQSKNTAVIATTEAGAGATSSPAIVNESPTTVEEFFVVL